MKYICDKGTKIHSRNLKKPNEDFIFSDCEKGIFMVLDGVTRVHDEYDAMPMESAACCVNKIFSAKVVEYICENIEKESKEQLLRDAVRAGLGKVCEYRKLKTEDEWNFYPATVGIIALMCKNRMHYFCVGDCIGVVLRGNSKIIFGNERTASGVDALGVSKKERYEKYCNHPENPLSYSVINGDNWVAESGEYAFLDICDEDVVIISSDGAAKAIQFEKNKVLCEKTAEEIIELSLCYDIPPFAQYSDDKAVLKLKIVQS